MARYVLIRCESNDSADKLIEKFEPLSHVNVVGLFVACSKFCECGRPEGQRIIKSKRWGTSHCSICKLPMRQIMQHPINMIAKEGDLRPHFTDLFLGVWEPFHNEPEKVYGKQAMDNKRRQKEFSGKRVARSQRRRARKKAISGG